MLNLPEDFSSQMMTQLGSEYYSFIASLEQSPPTSIRINPKKQDPTKNGQKVPWSQFGLYLPERPQFTLDPLLHAGSYYVQEASSMFLEQALIQTINLNQPLKVLDLCAAPGGKSTHILSVLNDNSLLVSNEIIKSRSAILSENIQKWGYPNVIVTNNDPEDFTVLEGTFDVIIVDAPCSGEGLFRKDKDAMKEWSVENVSLCSARQRRIVHDIWPALKEDGILVYSTCTYNPEENEKNLAILSDELDAQFVPLALNKDWNVSEVSYENVLGYRLMPHNLRGEGFFLSVMKKRGSTAKNAPVKSKKKLMMASSSLGATLTSWVVNAQDYSFIQHGELVFAFPTAWLEVLQLLLQNLKIVYAGVNLAEAKRDKLIPEHALAVSTIVNREQFNALDVNLTEAIQYLRRETLQRDNALRGFALIQYENINLGWVNLLQNRINNLYPQEWRIRMAPR
jgi:16S rRNA C967 or C1407 C5-methylase (RsmB/RsmF family)/NOL1/NOP2/fmu family ribosome biogenesis protein